MKRPHEEAWTWERLSPTTTPAVVNETKGVIAVVQTVYVQDAERMTFLHDHASATASLLSAAPDMARALLRNLHACSNTGSRTKGCVEAGVTHTCAACETKAALKKAGVLT